MNTTTPATAPAAILANAALLRSLHTRVNQAAFRSEFEAKFDALAFPGGLGAALDRLDAGDALAVELAVAYLEADPEFRRADAVKRQVAGRLGRTPLSPRQRDRLAAVVLRSLRHGSDELAGAYAALAPAVATPLFQAAVTCYAASCEYPLVDRAARVLDVLRANETTPPPRLRLLAGRLDRLQVEASRVE